MARSFTAALTLLALLHAAPAALSQTAPAGQAAQQPQPGVSQRQRADVRLRVQTGDGRTQFRMGEVIPLKLYFTSSAAKKYQINLAAYDRSGRMNYEEFALEPDAGWSDPLENYFAGRSFIMGGLTSFSLLSAEPTVIPIDLNEWVRFDRPGRYTLRVVSRRVGALSGEGSYDAATELASDELRLTILPAERAWQQATLKKAAAVLDRYQFGDGATPTAARAEEVQAALKTLRYLGTAEAARELARRLRGEDARADYECMFGLVGSRFREAALGEMRRLLADPDHPVSSTFLYAMVALMRGGGDVPFAARMEEDKRNGEVVRGELLNALSQKRGKALAFTLNALMEAGDGGKARHLDAQLTAQVAAAFDQLPAEKQMALLESRWDLIKGPEFLPVLRKYARRYKEFTVPNEENAYNSLQVSGAALRHWYELNPAEARPVVIEEITRPRPRYGADVLDLLPDETLPEAEQALAEHFEAEPESYAAENVASLLNRYATAAVLPRVLPVVDEHVGRWACALQAPILAYLLKADPAAAKPRIEAAVAARGDDYSACNHSLFVEVGALWHDPVLEEIAVRSLNDEDPEVSGDAATYLGKYGSAAAEAALWERLTSWSEKWQGREREFRHVPGESNAQLWQGNFGANLVNALATGQSWLADEEKLRRLRQLAVGRNVRQQLDSMLSDWERGGRMITFYRAGDRPHYRVMQYEADSLESFLSKLAQFPAGTEFFWGSATDNDDAAQVFRELAEALAKRGMKLEGLRKEQ